MIMHGHSTEYKKVQKLIKTKKFTPIVLINEFKGKFILKNVQNAVWDFAHCAIVVMSPDDAVQSSFRARQNVIFELGYCMGAFDSIPKKYWYPAVIIIKEKSVEIFADIAGLQYIEYEKTIKKEQLAMLSRALDNTFEKAAEFYAEL